MSQPIARYEFGSFVADLTSRTLRRHGEDIPLAPKAFELLVALLERPRRVVSKREILDRVWPDTFVDESNIAQNVSLLRKALQDGTDGDPVVVTVPRVGYQFTAAVRALPPLESLPPPAGEGFSRYVRGRHDWNKRTEEGLTAAFHHALETIEADPVSPRGYVGLADTYNLMGAHGILSPREAFSRARAAARRALEVDDRCGEAYCSLAFVDCWFDWDFAEGERNFRRGAELSPGYATTYDWLGEALACTGRYEESLSIFETAMLLDPLSSAIRANFATALSLAGRYEKCEAAVSEIRKFGHEFARALIVLSQNCERAGDFARSYELATQAVEQEQSAAALAIAARTAARLCLHDEARARLEQLERREATGNVVLADLAGVCAALGEYDEARRLIRLSFEKREPHFAWLVVEPAGDVLRDRTGLLALWASRTQRVTR